MTSGHKPDKRIVVPGLALLALLVVVAEAPASADGQARSTRTSAAPRVQSSSSSSSSSSSTSTAAGTRTAAPRATSGAASTRRSTPASRGRNRGHSHRGHYPRYYSNFGLSFGYGYGGWGGYYYPFYYHPFYWGVSYYEPRRAYRQPELGAFDLNVRPKKAEVYLDGQYIGKAGKYDGFPDHLWLEPGSYELIFYRPGLATEKRVLSIYPGVVVDVRLNLGPGESVKPSELSTADRSVGVAAEVRAAYDRRPPSTAPAGAEMDTRATPGRVRLNVLPADASVYMDGRLLGSGDEVGGLHAGLVVEAGSHFLEVVRPGYATERLEFAVTSGDEIELEVLLETG